MDDRELRDQLMTLLLAGHETTAMALSWAWWLLSSNPTAALPSEYPSEQAFFTVTFFYNEEPQ